VNLDFCEVPHVPRVREELEKLFFNICDRLLAA